MTFQKRLYYIVAGVLALLAILAILLLATTPAGSTVEAGADTVSNLVGICLSGKNGSALSSQLTQVLQDRGFRISLFCADGSVATQRAQLQTVLGADLCCLILQPVDSYALPEHLADAKQKNIPVIACDTMVMNSDWVWGCVSFDYYTLGKLMAQRVVEAKNLDAEDAKTWNIELFMDAPERHSSLLLHQGAMEVFTPYLRSGKLKVPSGRTLFEDTYTPGTTDGALECCALRLKAGKPDIVFAGSDEIAAGCKQALLDKGYTLENWPVLIGQGGSNAQAVKDGYQLATFAKAPVLLAEGCADALELLLAGQTLPAGTTRYNHVLDVPTKLLPASVIDD